MKVNDILKEGKLRASWNPGKIAGLSKKQIDVLIKNATDTGDKEVLDMIAAENLARSTKESAKKNTQKALSKDEKLAAAKLEKIPDSLTSSDIEKIIIKSDGSIGATVEDIHNRKNIIYTTSTGDKVAGLKCRASVMIDLTDMFDQQTIDTMYDGKDVIDDSMQFTIYRNPAKPKELLGFVSA